MAQGFPEFSVARHHNSGAPNRFPHARHSGLPRTPSLRRRRYTPEPRVTPPKKQIPYAEGVTQKPLSDANGISVGRVPSHNSADTHRLRGCTNSWIRRGSTVTNAQQTHSTPVPPTWPVSKVLYTPRWLCPCEAETHSFNR